MLPGVLALLAALDARTGATVALLTGNFARGAAVKLGYFNLWHRFAFGAFGDDEIDRRALVPIALGRAAAAGLPVFAPDRVIVIGDTPLDVDCAKANGARAIGVATGPVDRTSLADSGADLAVDTLEDMDRLVEWIVA